MTDTPIEGIDYKAGLVQYQMDKIYNRILASYLRSVPGMLDTLAASCEEDLDSYLITVHGLKGASYGVQANHIGDLAGNLERAAKEADMSFIRENNQHFLDETRSLLSRLEVFLNTQG